MLKKFNNNIDYTNIRLLKAFLNKYGKIKPRRKTRLNVQKQREIAKAIRKSRALGLIPFTCDIKFLKYEDEIWLIECFLPKEKTKRNVNSRMWICDTIEGVKDCIENNF